MLLNLCRVINYKFAHATSTHVRILFGCLQSCKMTFMSMLIYFLVSSPSFKGLKHLPHLQETNPRSNIMYHNSHTFISTIVQCLYQLNILTITKTQYLTRFKTFLFRFRTVAKNLFSFIFQSFHAHKETNHKTYLHFPLIIGFQLSKIQDLKCNLILKNLIYHSKATILHPQPPKFLSDKNM